MHFVSRFLSSAFLTTSLGLATTTRRNLTSASSIINSCCQAVSISALMNENYPIGLGTYSIAPDQIASAIHSALKVGYRRIDCAPVYFNEDKIGDALTKEIGGGVVSREDLFIVSKLASPFHKRQHVKLGLLKTLNDLRVDYLDLYLIHWPQAFYYVDIDPSKRGYENEDFDESDGGKLIDPSVSIHETWEAMEELVDEGLVKHIGVSNFPVSLLHELMTRSRIPPAVNQVEAHPYLQQTRLLQYCQARGVHFQAYSPLGTPGYKEDDEPRILDDEVLKKIAKAHGVSVANICIAWAVQRGTSVVAKSANARRQAENLQTTTISPSITLTDDEMSEIAKLERGYRFFRPEDWWGNMAMAVFH
jgi:alcohol dehydrogenase (NADP+)